MKKLGLLGLMVIMIVCVMAGCGVKQKTEVEDLTNQELANLYLVMEGVLSNDEKVKVFDGNQKDEDIIYVILDEEGDAIDCANEKRSQVVNEVIERLVVAINED